MSVHVNVYTHMQHIYHSNTYNKPHIQHISLKYPWKDEYILHEEKSAIFIEQIKLNGQNFSANYIYIIYNIICMIYIYYIIYVYILYNLYI